MCKFYGYVRVSTETQAEKGGGLDVQTQAIKRYAASHKIEITRIFVDAGISGTKENRPALDELLLETLAAGDVIIVHNTSRLWRSIFAQTTVMKAVMDAKANIKSIDEPSFDVYRFMTDPDNFMISSMMGMLDQWERMTITRKLARGRATKASKGDKPAGIAPYGYQYSPDGKHIDVNETEAATVKRMFTLAQTGATLSKIATEINATGAIARRGKPFTRGSIGAILTNRFYVGELTHAGQTITGNHKPIVSKVQFGKVASQLSKHKKKPPAATQSAPATTPTQMPGQEPQDATSPAGAAGEKGE